MINLWKDGFQTESYKVISLSLENEMELVIINEDLEEYRHSVTKKETVNGVETDITYRPFDNDKLKLAFKQPEFKLKVGEIQTLLIAILGEDFVKSLKVTDYFYTIISLHYEINIFKESLKKK